MAGKDDEGPGPVTARALDAVYAALDSHSRDDVLGPGFGGVGCGRRRGRGVSGYFAAVTGRAAAEREARILRAAATGEGGG